MRLFVLLSLLLVMGSPAPALGQTEQPRTSIALFRYRGAVPGSPAGAGFDAFRGLIEQKIENLRFRLETEIGTSANGANDLDYMNNLYVDFRQEDSFHGPAEVENWMRNEHKVLETMRGTVLPTGDGFYFTTRLHVIADPPSGRMRVFSLDLALTPAEFANTRDSHSLVILYSIAVEAHRLGLSRDKIAIMIGEAFNALADLERRQGQLSGNILEIKDALHALEDEL
ncbi:hypothetical protein [Aestuariispira ectoiniformans]|uniref:hypothetical protein n=1 Tax=Aestuariispira ectoiniformans TaxID=2775080 RepID=UPI00223BE417|nr:hypothetical protein [Aestuariispira ectoiniformans]